MSFEQSLIASLVTASGISSNVVSSALSRPKDLQHGDFSFPCFPLAKEWKMAPPAAAEKLKAQIQLPAEFERAEVINGYLNFFLNRELAAKKIVNDIQKAGLKYGQTKNAEVVVIDYSSPNIAKPFHIGHLRTTLLGLSLDRLYRHLGYQVVSVNHLGDWGTQFGFVYAGCEIWGRPGEDTLDAAVEIYQRASRLRKQQEENTVPAEDADKPNVNQMARDYFIRLEQKDPAALEFWRWSLDLSLNYLKKLYARLGIHFDYYTGESFYFDKLPAVEELLKNSGILETSNGALGVELGKELGFARVFADDGRSLYITRDIAAATYREATFKPAKILYVVGAPQILHFKQLRGIFEKLGSPLAQKIVHIPYGHVPGISTRAGNVSEFSLERLIEEARTRALDAYHNQVTKRPNDVDEMHVAEAVGLGAVYFNYLCRSNIKDFHFNWEEALTFQGDTGPYIQYAIARLHSIEAKAREAGITPAIELNAKALVTDEAYLVINQLSRFEETLARAAREYEPYIIANYLLDLAKSFSTAYTSMRVVGEVEADLAPTRLALFIAVRNVLTIGSGLLGMTTLEKM